MKSRTADGKHTKRFIVLVNSDSDGKYIRSGNNVIEGFFPTKKEALKAVKLHGSAGLGLKYKVIQK